MPIWKTSFQLMIRIILSVLCLSGFSCWSQKDSLEIDKIARKIGNELHDSKLSEFSYTDLNGNVIDTNLFSGKVVVLNFWFIGCPPCMGEIPDLNQLNSYFKDSAFVLISLAKNDSTSLQKFRMGEYFKPPEAISYPIIPSCDPISQRYNITGYPTSIFIDKKGIIRVVLEGANLQSLRNYVEVYGTKLLSSTWKKFLRSTAKESSSSQFDSFRMLISELLNE